MGLTDVEKSLVEGGNLSNFSIAELTELCFAQQYPELHLSDDNPAGYIPKGMEVTLENFVDVRPARMEFWTVRNKYDISSNLGKLVMRGKLRSAEVAQAIPEDAKPVFVASREFKNIFDLRTGKWRHPHMYFRITDTKLITGPEGEIVQGSESRLYELRKRYEYLGREHQTLSRQEVRAYFESGYAPDQSPYEYYDDRPEPETPLLTPEELRFLLIRWGELDRPIQLELNAS